MKQTKKLIVTPTVQQLQAFLAKLLNERKELEAALSDKDEQIEAVKRALEDI